MENNLICSFFGHRDIEITQDLYTITYKAILNALDHGCRIFYFGGYGDFDQLCYKIVTEIKSLNSTLNITRIYCVADEKYLHKKVRYFNREDYDDIVFLPPSFNGWYKRIYFRNLKMIDESDYIIFFAENRENSGAYKCYKYAIKKHKKVINIFN